MIRATTLCCCLAVVSLSWPGAAPAITGTEVIERMQERFADAKSYEARFEKQFYWAVLDKSMSREGRIYTRRPGQFRVEVDDGDLVVMESVKTVADGEMAAVRLKRDEETTLKRFYAEGPTVRLQPANSTMEPLRVSADDVEVIGKVVAVWRYLN